MLNLAKILKAESVPYLALNLIGAVLACASSWMIDFMPFVILEGTWAGGDPGRPRSASLPGGLRSRLEQCRRLGVGQPIADGHPEDEQRERADDQQIDVLGQHAEAAAVVAEV